MEDQALPEVPFEADEEAQDQRRRREIKAENCVQTTSTRHHKVNNLEDLYGPKGNGQLRFDECLIVPNC